MLLHGLLLDVVTGEGLPSPVWVVMRCNQLCRLAFGAHALLGHQQNCSGRGHDAGTAVVIRTKLLVILPTKV